MPATPDRPVSAYREFTAEQRKKLAGKGHALADGSFPIETVDDLKNAIQAVGRAKDKMEAEAHIKKRAKELNVPFLIPEEWSAEPLVFRTNFTSAELAVGEWFVQKFRAPDFIGASDEPGENWVEQEGGLPSYIKRIANHLIGKGMTESHAIASAVNTVKRWARGGSAAKHGKGNVKPDTIAKAIVALAHWMAMRAAAAAHASMVLTFAASTADEVAEAEADVAPDDGDTLSAIQDGFDYLSEWIADEANADDPVFDMVKEALDKVGPQLQTLKGKNASQVTTLAADAAVMASAADTAPAAAEMTDPADTAPAAAEAADPADTAPAAAEAKGDDPGLNVPLEQAQTEYAALIASADSIVEELTTEYNEAVAALEPPG